MIYFTGNQTSKHYQMATIDDVVNYCSDKKVLGCDTETEGLDFTKHKIIMLQIGDEENQYVIDTRTTDITPLKEILEDEDIQLVFHNTKFDYKFIRQSGIICENIYDTMLSEKVITCGKNLTVNLKDCLERRLNITLNKEERTQFIGMTTQPFTEKQIIYGSKDVKYLLLLKAAQEKLIKMYNLQNVIDLENQATLALGDIEYNGLNLDAISWKELEDESKLKGEALMLNLDQIVTESTKLKPFVSKYIQTDMFTDIKNIRKVNVKWTSPKQVLAVFKTFLPKLENVNGKELYNHKSKFKIIDTYIKYKEVMKLYTSYGDKFLENLKSDDKIHTNFHQILDTGRVSSSRPNMQQIPADNKFRNCFTAPNGWKFVSADYSSQELNVIAFGSKDPVWIEALKKGEDLHSTCAELVYGSKWSDQAEPDCAYMKNKSKCNCKEHKRLRTNVKTINFGLAYGMGSNKLAETLNISKDDAEKLIKKYFTAFPSIKSFLDKLGNFGKKYGYIKTFPPYHRRRWFSNWFPKIYNSRENSQELSSIERASKNTPIQGASADMTKRALVMMREEIDLMGLPVKLVMTVHDQIDTICKDHYVDTWKHKMKAIMEEAALEIVTNGLLKAEVTISNCWEK